MMKILYKTKMRLFLFSRCNNKVTLINLVIIIMNKMKILILLRKFKITLRKFKR